jgi:hypothetical protein
MATVICVDAHSAPRRQVTIPGIGVLQEIRGQIDTIPSPGQIAMLLMQQLNPTLSPIISILRVVQVIKGILDAFLSVKKAIKKLSPKPLIQAIKELQHAFQAVAVYLPGVAYAKAVRDLLSLVADLMDAIVGLIRTWITEGERITNAVNTANSLGDAELIIYAECARGNLLQVQTNAQVTLESLSVLIKILVLIMQVIKSLLGGLGEDVIKTLESVAALLDPENPDQPNLVTTDANELEEALEDIEDAAGKLHQVAAFITGLVGT